MTTAVDWLIDEYFGGIENCTPDFRFHIQQAKEVEKEQKVYSKEDLFKILLDFVAFPHHDMEPRGSIIERYLNELSKKKFNN
jgi:hypothetical protein